MPYVGEKLSYFADRYPDAVAIRQGATSLSWNHFFIKVAQVQQALTKSTKEGDRIALLLNEPLDVLICFFACARSCRIALVMDPSLPTHQLDALLDEVKPKVRVDPATLESFLPEDQADLFTRSEDVPTKDTPFYAGFTSGSTGSPKGYVRTHGSWLESIKIAAVEFGDLPNARVVIPGQLSHSLHLFGAVAALHVGQEVVLTTQFEPKRLLRDLEQASEGAILYATPTQLHLLAAAARRTGPILTVYQVLASGAKWQASDRENLQNVFPNAKLFEFYGASETSFITISPPTNVIPAGSVGRAAAGVEILIGTPENPYPVGHVGPIWVRSQQLFSGYICGAAPETHWHEGWLTIGDRGFLDKEGNLFLSGRENRMIVTSGVNVYPEEVETVLSKHPVIDSAVVFGIRDDLRGERLEAAVKLTNDSSPNALDDILQFCRAQLAAAKVPRKIHFCQEFPLTPGGKPDIQSLVGEFGKKGPTND